jgi:membrane protein YdbS with pleckstrin-like domain
MYCQNCSSEITAGANFCQNCGAQMSKALSKKDSTGAALVLKPQFLSLSMFLSMFGWQILFTLWGGLLLGIIGLLLGSYYSWNISFWTFALVAGAFFFVLTPLVLIFLMFNRYSKTEFLFFKDRLEFRGGIFNLQKKTIHYQDIIELNLRSGIFQKFSGIGDITVITAATNRKSDIEKEGIRLFDIPNPEECFNKIKLLINKA